MYGKVFESIYTGSLYGQLEATCMMQALIVFADEDGFIDMSFNAIVGRTGYPREFVLKGMTELMAPDPVSRTEGEEGRRILPVTPSHSDTPEGVNGFKLVNHSEYRDMANRADKRERDRERQQRSRANRAKKHEEKASVTPTSRPVTPASQPVTKSRLSEADTEADTERKKKVASATSVTPRGGGDVPRSAKEFVDRWNRWAKSPSAKGKIKTVLKVTKERRNKINARLRDPEWFASFRVALDLLPLAAHETGDWQPTLDWFVKNESNALSILEGKFDFRLNSKAARDREKLRQQHAAREREKRIEQQKLEDKAAAAGTRKAIENTLNPERGSDAEKPGSSLLFG